MEMKTVRKWCRNIHRELSFLFTGVILVYAISGIALNHKKDFNSDYIVKQESFVADGVFPMVKEAVNKDYVLATLKRFDEENNFTKFYFPDEQSLKVFIKGGSSVVVNMNNGSAVYESIKKRPVLHVLNRLHYNPGKGWTIFSDVFASALIIIAISGLFIVRGNKGLWGRGGIELAIGILIPLLFIYLI